MADLRALLKEGKYSDLTIICQKKEFKVHRNIICAQSPVLAAAIDGENQVGNLVQMGLKPHVTRRSAHLSNRSPMQIVS